MNADLIVTTTTLLRTASYHFSEDLGQRISQLPEVKRVENARFTSLFLFKTTALRLTRNWNGWLTWRA